MRRLLAFLASTLLIWGCEELFPTEKPMITLDSDQAKSVTVSGDGESFDVAFDCEGVNGIFLFHYSTPFLNVNYFGKYMFLL